MQWRTQTGQTDSLAKVQPQFASSVLANANGGDARKLWLSGESYAGKYVPYLATEIGTYEDPLSQSLLAGGLAIGDGWVDPPIIVASYPLFAYSHGLVDYPQRIAMEKNVSLFQAALAQQKFELATEMASRMTGTVTCSLSFLRRRDTSS